MDKKFAARFDVSQHRVDNPFSQIIGPHGQKIFVAAAGDSLSSPHFMRYSGLTGARENILHLFNYSQTVNQDPENQTPALLRLDKAERRTADFVIARGRNFLTPLSGNEINQNRKNKMLRSLQMMSDQQQKNQDAVFQLKKMEDGAYLLIENRKNKGTFQRLAGEEEFSFIGQNDLTYRLTVNDKGQLVRVQEGGEVEVTYDSLMQMLHELDLSV